SGNAAAARPRRSACRRVRTYGSTRLPERNDPPAHCICRGGGKPGLPKKGPPTPKPDRGGRELTGMLSILVCHSYFLSFDQKQQQRAKPYPPLATLQVASLLRNGGHRIALFDAMLAEDYSGFERQIDAFQPQLVLLYEDNYNFLSKMCL